MFRKIDNSLHTIMHIQTHCDDIPHNIASLAEQCYGPK